MRLHKLETEQRVQRPLPEIFDFFARPENLQRITPPWLSFEIVGDPPAEVTPGLEIDYRLRVHGVPTKWRSSIDVFVPDREFIDRQLKGPYSVWIHHHQFEADGDATIIRDTVRYQIPFSVVGAAAHLLFVRRDLERIFAFRHRSVEEIFGS
jgi:ligand-binding SRPBCC domain-containing protein